MRDPVCGMTVGRGALKVDGHPELGFCSNCRQSFLADPEGYSDDGTASEDSGNPGEAEADDDPPIGAERARGQPVGRSIDRPGLSSPLMPDTFSHTAVVDAPKAAVWSALQRAETWKNIGPIEEVWDATHAEDGSLAGYRWSARAAGRTWKGVATTFESVREHRMRLALESPEIHGGITVDLGTGEITVSMDAAPKGVLATMFWGTVRRALQSGLPAQVEAFAKGL